MKNFCPIPWRRSLSACVIVLSLVPFCAVLYARQQPPKKPISADKAKMVMEYRFVFDKDGKYVKHETLKKETLPEK